MRLAVSDGDRAAPPGHASRLSIFVAPASIDGGADAVRRRFVERHGREPSLLHTGTDAIAACRWDGCREVGARPGAAPALVVHGDVHGDAGPASEAELAAVAARFARGDAIGAAAALKGSFVAVAPTPERLNVVTDRVASRKVFRWDTPQGTWLDTDLRAFVDRPADPAGIASMIINRCTYAGRTILAGVASMQRASVHVFDGTRCESRAYWRYDFADADVAGFERDPAGQRAELWDLIGRAIRRRLPADGTLLLSLSGGVDSRAILAGVLASGFPAARIACTSYGAADDDDAVVASELAAHAGLAWHLVPGSGQLPRLLQLNAEYGGGQVFFYPRGLDGLRERVAALPAPVTAFVGDECYGWNHMPLHTPDDALWAGVGIRSPASVPAYYSYGAHSHRVIEDALRADCEALKQRHAQVAELHDVKDMLYLDQRLCHMLLPWREQHTGRFARVANPHIDDDILEFMKRVPTEWRLDKRLYRETAKANFGSLGAIRFARAGGCSNDFLDALFARDDPAVDAMIDDAPSALDAVLPPELIRAGLAALRIDLRQRLGSSPAAWSRLAAAAARFGVRRRFVCDRAGRSQALPGAHGMMALAPMQMATVLLLRRFLTSTAR